ncbi:Abc transporter g family member 31 [Globisporangium polare]
MDDDTQLQVLLDAVVVPLSGLLSVDIGRGSSVDELPQLTVSFWLIKGGANSPRKIEAKVQPALQAIAQLMAHSQQVSGSPVKKARLWRRVLQDPRLFGGSMAAAVARKLDDWVLQSEAFPPVALDFSRTKVCIELADAICRFFQSFSAVETVDGRAGTVTEARRSQFGLKFAQCRLKSQDLRLIHQLLDRICSETEHRAEQKRSRFRVCSLDLSDNGMNAAELLEVALILKRSDVYRLEEVVLENITGRNLGGDGLSSPHALVEAAFDVDTIVKPTSAMRHRLVRLSLQGNSLGSRAYASICSAFRHSHAVRDLSLAGTLSLHDASQREGCWRWLAFGLFYPRPSGSRVRFKTRKIDLSGNPLYPNDIEALRRTLAHPVAELLPRDEADMNRLAFDEAEDNKVGALVSDGLKLSAQNEWICKLTKAIKQLKRDTS